MAVAGRVLPVMLVAVHRMATLQAIQKIQAAVEAAMAALAEMVVIPGVII